MIIVLFGVSGSGKTTIGKNLSHKLQIPFFDADDFHPQANIEKMASGQPLNDQDRHPWLLRLGKHLHECSMKQGAILACSALKETPATVIQYSYPHRLNRIGMYLEANHS